MRREIVATAGPSASPPWCGRQSRDDTYGEAGHDVLLGGPGDDQLDASGFGDDNTKDRLSCGGGFDTVFANSKDKVPSDCEDVILE
jgi:hypothetical protein